MQKEILPAHSPAFKLPPSDLEPVMPLLGPETLAFNQV